MKVITETFETACKLCKNQGGVIWYRDHPRPYKYRYDKRTDCYVTENGEHMEVTSEAFDGNWVCELPETSEIYNNAEMIECTLEVAATRTRKEGGTFYQKDTEKSYIYHYDVFEEKFLDQHGKTFDLQGLDFERVWIYVPPDSPFRKAFF